MPIPIDNCPHSNIGYDENAEQEYCLDCKMIFADSNEGWKDPSMNNDD